MSLFELSVYTYKKNIFMKPLFIHSIYVYTFGHDCSLTFVMIMNVLRDTKWQRNVNWALKKRDLDETEL